MSLREQLSNAMQGNVVVMGIGNPCRGDDAAGSCVAQQIRSAPGVRVIDAQDVPENYLGQVMDQRPDTVLLIDCVDMKSAPGSVALFDEDRTTAYWPSTHRVPVCQLVDYLERTTNARDISDCDSAATYGFPPIHERRSAFQCRGHHRRVERGRRDAEDIR